MERWINECWFLISVFGVLLMLLGFFWPGFPQRCEACRRRLGPPTAGELQSGRTIGCSRCNLNLPR